MDHFFFGVVFAGFIYVVTPGPAFLSIIAIASEQNRCAAAKFCSGTVFGCMAWLVITVTSFVEADRLPPFLFRGLGIACALYLFWLGYRMLIKGNRKEITKAFKRPFYDGLFLGFLNPKSYPVMISVFSALIYTHLGQMSWSNFPAFYIAAVTGFLMGYIFMVIIAGFKPVTNIYCKKTRFFSYVFSAIYIGFGVNLLVNALV